MNWDQLVLNVKEFFNQPLVIILTSIASTVVGAIAIISKTSFGKRAIRHMREKIKEINAKVVSNYEIVSNVKELAYEKIEALKAEYERKTKVLVSQYDLFITSVLEILALYPNVKIQERVEQFKTEYEAKKVEIENVIGWAYEDVDKYIAEKKSELETYIEEAKQLVLDLESKKEKTYEERESEETENTISAQETI